MKKGSIRGLAVLCVVTAVAIAVPRTAAAQVQPATSAKQVGVYLNFHFGMNWPAEATFVNSGQIDVAPNLETVNVSYPLDSGIAVEIGGGVVIKGRWIVGAAYTHAGSSANGTFTVELTHPPTHGLITDTTTTAPFDREENTIHVQGGILLPMGKVEVMLFGGPSRISVSQLEVYDLAGTEALVSGEWTVNITQLFSAVQHASAWGYNFGGDVSYAFGRGISVGVQGRYSRATVSMEDKLATSAATIVNGTLTKVFKDQTVGGLVVTGGVRVRF